MKRGGQVIYAGPLGHHSHKLVEYFEVSYSFTVSRVKTYSPIARLIIFTILLILQAIPAVPKIQEGYNPATWMLDVSTAAMETQFDVDFAEIYANSDLYR